MVETFKNIVDNFFKNKVDNLISLYDNLVFLLKQFWNQKDKRRRNEIIAFTIFMTYTLWYFFALTGTYLKIVDYLLPRGNDFGSIRYTILTGNIFYVLVMICKVKTIFLSFVINLLFVSNWTIFDLENNLLYLYNFFKTTGTRHISHFFIDWYAHELWGWTDLKVRYLNEWWFRTLVVWPNLPVFWYFGVLYVFTTIFSFFLLSYLGLYGVFFINLVSMFLFWLSIFLYFNKFFFDNMSYKINLGKWFIVSVNYVVFFEIFIDSVSYSFILLTVTIAFFVFIYAFSYFRYEPNVERLLLLINCFVISMLLLVTSGNFFVLFLGWELIGLTSFFLINFWSTRISTLKSAFKAFTFNKLSDACFLTVLVIIFYLINDINIQSFLTQIDMYNNYYINVLNLDIPVLELICFFFIVCAFIKSAQFGFHVWLPDSMEAPVPASALIHSATLVSSGVFLLLRLSSLFEYSIYSYYIIPLIGSFTALFGGVCATYQSDIKKILAYSTISHCGFLMICYSTYISEYTVLYLYIHGFFKAAVFLCVGNIIRFSKNYQDFRRMGMFWKYLPFECFSSFICLINLCGLPFTLGFYIKHLLLVGLNMGGFINYFILSNILGGAITGLIYSYRLFYNVFFDFKKAKKPIYKQSIKNNLNDECYYSNTTLASNYAIFLLIISAYIICILLFNCFLNPSSMGEGLDVYSINSSQYDNFNHPVLTLFNNIGYFNWLLLFILISLILYSWRRVYKYYNVINVFSFVVTLFILFYIFYIFLV